MPIAYHRSSDGALEAVTSTKGVWWRNLREQQEIWVVHRGAVRQARVEVITGDAAAITKALRSRDACRRLLVPAAIEQTVLLRIHLLPSPDKVGRP
ncbi:MAG: hypothetical protein HY681_06750 [Chloroflexi bacterium]|nr:hypothetical protein [Chloroflexota bacterium]